MKKKSLVTVVLCLAAGISIIYAQVNPCGSGITMSQRSLEKTFTIKEGKPSNSLPQLNKVISIAVFVVKEKEAPYFDTSVLPGIISNLNTYFRPIALSFKLCATTTINNFQFDNAVVDGNTKDLTIQYSEPNTINLYLVSTLIDTTGTSVCGFSYMPGDAGKNYIFMNKNCIQGITLAHQLGHFFNLYHTSETVFGEELPDGTNCSTTGDRCCDTDASPDLSIINMVYNCLYVGTVKRNSQIFSPSTKNIMTLGPSSCQCVFSRTQLLRISYAVANFRNYLR